MGNISQFPKRPRALKQRGMGMLQLMVILGALMALVVGLSYKTSDYFSKSQALDSDALLHLADNQLRQYIVANGRLPCPALSGDGLAPASCDSTQQKGYLPYKTLGMVENNYVYGEVPILYGVYNDGTINFASTAQIFFPTYAEKNNTSTQVTTSRNTFDFCASLEALQAKNSVLQSAGLSMAGQYNAVFALALPGKANRDGLGAGGTGWAGSTGVPSINAQYDGLNALHATQFELPQKPVSPTYDDRTAFRGPTDLHDYLRCDAMNSSVSLLTEAVTIQKEVEDFADNNSEDATKGVVLNAVGIALATWELVQDIAAVSEASEQIGIAAGLLATVTATCPLPPWVTCALIPVYATSLTSANVGLGLAIGAAVSAGIALGLEITATVLYADVKSRTSSIATDPVPPKSNLTGSGLSTLKSNYATSKSAAQTKYSLLPLTAPNVPALDQTQKSAATTLSNDIAAVTDGTLKTLLGDVLNGSSVTCVAGSTGCTTTDNVPQLNAAGVLTKVDPSQGLLTCSNSGSQTSDWCLANGYDNMLKTVVYSKTTTTYCDISKSSCTGYTAGTATTSYVNPTTKATCALNPQSGCVAAGFTQTVSTVTYSKTVTLTCDGSTSSLASACVAAGYTAKGVTSTYTSSTKSGLSATYYPGAIPSVDGYYQSTKTTVNADGTTNTPSSNDIKTAMNLSNNAVNNYGTLLAAIANFDQINLNAYQAALTANASLLTRVGGVNELAATRDTAWINYQNYLSTHCATLGCTGYDANYSANSQGYLNTYNNALSAWNTANNSYNQAVTTSQVGYGGRSTALDTLNNAMGTSGWDNTSHTSLCGGGSTTTSSCAWMTGNTASAGTDSTFAVSGSSAVNAYLVAYEAYRNADAFKAAKAAADSAATSAWSDRNAFKSALCAVKFPTASTWLGGPLSVPDPGSWDTSEQLQSAGWSGSDPIASANLSVPGLINDGTQCTGSATGANTSSQSAAARSAEMAKYCVGGSAPDTALCALYSAATPAHSTIQGAKPIVDALITKGIAR